MKNRKFYRIGVKIEEPGIKWLNLYDYKSNALASKERLNAIGFKPNEIIMRTINGKRKEE